MKVLAFLIIGIMIAGAALFSVQNAAAVSLQFLSWRSIEFPLGFLLTLGFVVGLLLAVFGVLAWRLTEINGDNDEVSFADHATLGNDETEDWG
ncbi:MAG: hypothetical protein MH252_10900 [Thermosynechococcaceae cyanobacterium MS004]|nr:hypothetical protein [Thermosynechococcaceae cyanobacterium MS004]